MPRSALVGYTGFVGSNLRTQARFDALYNSKTIETIAGEAFELLVFSATQSQKWWANKNPDADWDAIARTLKILETVRADRVVVMSTIDVVPPAKEADETADCHAAPTHAYGENRLAMEQAFAAQFDNPLILRLPALYGPGLWKNIVFDLLTDNIPEKINPDATLQHYGVGRLWADIQIAQKADLRLVHMVTEPVATGEIIERFFPGKTVGQEAGPPAHYDYRSLHAGLFGGADGYLEDRNAVFARLGRFIEAWRSGEARSAGSPL